MVNKGDKKKTGKLFSKKNDRLFIAAMLALPLLHFAVFTCYINISSLVMAFQDLDFTTNQEYFVSFGNFTRFFKEFTQVPSWKSAIKNSALYFPVTNFITLPLSLIAAYFLFRKVPLSGCYKIVFFFPSIISIVVLAMVYRNMLDPTTGPVCLLLKKLGMTDETVPLFLSDPKFAMPSVYFYAIWAGIGFNVVMLSGAIGRVPAVSYTHLTLPTKQRV